mmetsp:Transcript_52880/g.141303  ORF Transcript_52880/g.141303 Transcript_52880/m.141303 type:complete len:221 (-) Transcript_52880:670-1332(-)
MVAQLARLVLLEILKSPFLGERISGRDRSCKTSFRTVHGTQHAHAGKRFLKHTNEFVTLRWVNVPDVTKSKGVHPTELSWENHEASILQESVQETEVPLWVAWCTNGRDDVPAERLVHDEAQTESLDASLDGLIVRFVPRPTPSPTALLFPLGERLLKGQDNVSWWREAKLLATKRQSLSLLVEIEGQTARFPPRQLLEGTAFVNAVAETRDALQILVGR